MQSLGSVGITVVVSLLHFHLTPGLPRYRFNHRHQRYHYHYLHDDMIGRWDEMTIISTAQPLAQTTASQLTTKYYMEKAQQHDKPDK